MSDFRWLIEAPGQKYLAVQRLNASAHFEWTADHNKALAFRWKRRPTTYWLRCARWIGCTTTATISAPS